MNHPTRLRASLWIVLAGWAGSSGCIHNHYYGTGVTTSAGGSASGLCGPSGMVMPAPVTSQVGQVCEVPSGQVVVSSGPAASGASTNVVVTPPRQGTVVASNPQRVVISQPAYGAYSGTSVSRFRWHRPDPETLATTRVEGALDGGTVRE